MRSKKRVDTFPLLAILIVFILIVILFGPQMVLDRMKQERASAEQIISQTITDSAEANAPAGFDYTSLPEYFGKPWIMVNDGVPFFAEEEIVESSFIHLGELDQLGRCTAASSCLSIDTVPQPGTERVRLETRPTGWIQATYKYIDDGDNTTDEPGVLYNRSHLLAFCLTGLQDEPRALITGTRYMNVDGMLPWETQVQEYIYNHPGNHIMYRVTPIFIGFNQLASGVLMEGYSVEDEGALQFCIYAYNVQPGISIEYSTGANMYSGVFLDTDASSVIYCG